MKVKVTLTAPPEYVITTISLDLQQGIALLNSALEAMRTSITSEGGSLTIAAPPKAVSDEDEKNMLAIIAKAEKQNAEQDERESDSD